MDNLMTISDIKAEPMDRKSMFMGCLFGGAVGDALGAPIEFMSIEQIRRSYGSDGITGYVEFPDHTGVFTDDTQMTLFTAEGILRAVHRAELKGIGGAAVPLTYHAYHRWLHTQGESSEPSPQGWGEPGLDSGWLVKERELHRRRSPGNTCIRSLKSGIPGTIENPINPSKGCGSIMRMAPVGLIYSDPQFVFKTGCEIGALTHGHPSGYLAAGYFATLIFLLKSGEQLKEAIYKASVILQSWPQHEEVLQAVNQAVDLFEETKTLDPPGTSGLPEVIGRLSRGWVAEEALSISLFCSLRFEHDYKNGVLASINHSGDSDSTGSITGNILGLINADLLQFSILQKI